MKKLNSKLPAALLFSGMLFLAFFGACSNNKGAAEEKAATNDSIPAIDTIIHHRPDPGSDTAGTYKKRPEAQNN